MNGVSKYVEGAYRFAEQWPYLRYLGLGAWWALKRPRWTIAVVLAFFATSVWTCAQRHLSPFLFVRSKSGA